jgi:hypothetical protein
MSDEVKKPEAGEYWEHETSGDRVYFIGATPENEMVWQCHGDTIEAGNLDWSDWKHLPDCKGRDWQPEAFPQWWTTITGDSLRPVAYVLRESKDIWALVYKDGTRHVFGVLLWCDSDRTQLTKEQAEAMLDKPNLIQSDPEEWVDLPQDHSLRAGVDQYLNHRGIYETVCGMQGTIVQGLDSKKAQCRRKDLPKIEPNTNRVAVRLYWYDGNIVGRYDHSQPTDQSFQEIKSDGNGGWYVEVSL